MADFKLYILGCGSAKPSTRHLPSCQAIEYRGKLMLVDCGEGAQLSLCRQHLNFARLTDVFISHLHGDHLLGLPGLLSTLSLHSKGGKVRVHIFEKGARMLHDIMSTVGHETSFEIEYDILDPHGTHVIYEDNALTVTSFPLYHSIPCVGFRFDEKPKPRHLRGDMAKFLNIPVRELAAIKAGDDFVRDDGTVFTNDRLTTPADHSASYAYCSDTMFNPAVAESVRGVDLLYHEATYGDEQAAKAAGRGHSTAGEAARIAQLAEAKRLLIGHYSSRYTDTAELLQQARAIFPDTDAANEGMTIDLS
ncbi:MAG: ribonuclease Z [Bacteroidales bacterium]|nr:ribonuclease Z [Bacteroidales bacterium]